MIQNYIDTKQKRTLLLLKLIIISLPFSIVANSLFIGLLIINTLLGLTYQEVKSAFSKRYLLLLLAAPFLFTLIGLLYSNNYVEGWKQIEKSLSQFVFPLIFIFVRPLDKKQLRELGYTFISVCLFILMFSFMASFITVIKNKSFVDVTKLTDRKYYYFTYELLAGTVQMSPIYLSIYFNLAIAYLFTEASQLRSKIKYSLIFLFGIYTVLLMSKMGILILILIIISSGIIFFTKKAITFKKGILLAIGLIAAVLAIGNFKPFQERVSNINYFDYDYSKGHISYWNGASLRMATWSCAVELMKENLILGVGTGNVEKALLEKYEEKEFSLGILLDYNAHSQYLHYTLRFGIVGLFVFVLICIFYPIYHSIKRREVFVFFVVLIYSFSFLTEAVLERHQGVVLFAFLQTILFHSVIMKPKIKKINEF